MITVNHFGLHWIEGDIGLLVQDKRVDHALEISTKFEVTTKIPRQGLTCPHRIELGEAMPINLPDDPVIRVMSPVPKEFGDKATFLADSIENKALIQELFRLTGGGVMFPLWQMRPELAAAHLQLTNLQPLVIFGYRLEYQQAFSKIIEASYTSPRRLIVMGPRHTVLREEIERLEPVVRYDDIVGLPLERAGAWALKQHMLRRD